MLAFDHKENQVVAVPSALINALEKHKTSLKVDLPTMK
jgi:hypothetical protein